MVRRTAGESTDRSFGRIALTGRRSHLLLVGCSYLKYSGAEICSRQFCEIWEREEQEETEEVQQEQVGTAFKTRLSEDPVGTKDDPVVETTRPLKDASDK